LLGNEDKYIRKFGTKLKSIYPDLIPHPKAPKIAHLAGGRSWVHVGHPSPGNGYLGKFLRDDGSAGQGEKRESAKAAIEYALDGMPLNRWLKPTSLGMPR
jgi:hypothetical protein